MATAWQLWQLTIQTCGARNGQTHKMKKGKIEMKLNKVILTDSKTGRKITIYPHHFPAMTFQNAYEFAEATLGLQDPALMKKIEDVLESGSSVYWSDAQLKSVGVTPDPKNEQCEYHRTWAGLRYRDLYNRLSRKARKEWRKSPKLMEMLSQ